MDPIILNNTLLMAIVAVCAHVVWCDVMYGRDYVLRDPKTICFTADVIDLRCPGCLVT